MVCVGLTRGYTPDRTNVACVVGADSLSNRLLALYRDGEYESLVIGSIGDDEHELAKYVAERFQRAQIGVLHRTSRVDARLQQPEDFNDGNCNWPKPLCVKHFVVMMAPYNVAAAYLDRIGHAGHQLDPTGWAPLVECA